MTTYDVIRALARRWYVVLLGLAVTLSVAATFLSRPGVYYVDGEVYLTAPASSRVGGIGDSNASLIAFAGLLEREVNAEQEAPAPVSADVTLLGMGVRHGTLVTLPNSGGQWNYHFTRPVLLVQAVASTSEEALRMYEETVGTIAETLARNQTDDGIAQDSRVTTRTVPRTSVVSYVDGYPGRAAAVVVLLGLAGTVLACVLLDHVVLTRRSRRAGRPVPGVGATVA